MSSFTLKIIAIASMFIDHVAWALSASPYFTENHAAALAAMHVAGRIAAPVFAFLIAEGAAHTHDIKTYLKYMLIFAVISEIPYDLLMDLYLFKNFDPLYLYQQNIMFTWSFAILAVIFYQNLQAAKETSQKIYWLLCIFFTLFISHLFRVDYGFWMVFFTLVLYILRDSKLRLPFFALMIFFYYQFVSYVHDPWWVFGGLLGAAVLFLYNGKHGRRMNKWIFYWFYPVHLLLISLIASLVFGII